MATDERSALDRIGQSLRRIASETKPIQRETNGVVKSVVVVGLVRQKVLARGIPAVELLWATTVPCVGKAGPLTTHRKAVRRLWSDSAHYESNQPQSASR